MSTKPAQNFLLFLIGGGLLLQSLLRFDAEDRARRQEDALEERQNLKDLRDELEKLKATISRR